MRETQSGRVLPKEAARAILVAVAGIPSGIAYACAATSLVS
jgi:hypothetical protein